jgi:SAM-dependent methyltransferase
VTFLRVFGLWLQEKEMAGRRDAGRVAQQLVAVAREIADRGAIVNGDRVLDLGSGTGAVGLAAADLGGRILAVDIDANALRRGRELARSIDAPLLHTVADARALPCADASFDVSVHRSFLVYMHGREAAVAEERRVLRSEGRVSGSESVGAELDLETSDRGIERVWRGGLRDILVDSPDMLTLTVGGLEALYAAEGFRDVAVEPRRHAVPLDSAQAVARAFALSPPAGLSAKERWERSGIPGPLIDEFLARLASEAEHDRPATLLATEAGLTARAPA